MAPTERFWRANDGAPLRYVGVDPWPVRHRHDRPGARVHDQRRGPAGGELLSHLLEDRLDLVLDRGVEREPQVQTRLREPHVAQRDRLAERVLDQTALAVGALKVTVARVLEPAQAVAVGAHGAQELGGHPALRVDPAALDGISWIPGIFSLPIFCACEAGRERVR